MGNFVITAVPGEFTTMAGRRLRNTIRDTVIESGGAANTKVVIAGLSNIYSDYIVTPEEYQVSLPYFHFLILDLIVSLSLDFLIISYIIHETKTKIYC